MGTPIQRLWHHVSHMPLLSFLHGHEPVSESPQASDEIALDTVAVMFKECEGVCEPTAQQLQAQERERADRFKGEQLLPIMGIGGGFPSPPP